MTKVLVAYGTKMQGTKEIALLIADTLTERGADVSVQDAHDVDWPFAADAVVLGSALYTGKWRPEVMRLLHVLVQSPPASLWVFHSGPLGDEHANDDQEIPKAARPMLQRLGISHVETFGGRLPANPPGLIAKLMARTGAGDWRDEASIRDWAEKIAAELGV